MKKMFKDIRHSDIDAIRASISKKPAVVNEYFDGKAPKKDVGQSPLQVAIKCGQFEIIQLLLENGADVDFMEDPAVVPPHSICMSVLHDAIIGAMDSLLYKNYEASKKYVQLIAVLLEKGADPNKKTCSRDYPCATPPLGTLVTHASEALKRYADTNTALFDTSKKHLFEILNLLKKHGADFEHWLDHETYADQSNREAFLDDFVPSADMPYEIKYHGRVLKGISHGDIDHNKEIRAAMQEYFKI